MINRRPYISCPLEAALAAKNFGFKFVSWHSGKEYELSVIINNAGSPIEGIKDRQRYVIAGEGLPLLEPVVDDVGEDEEGNIFCFRGGDWMPIWSSVLNPINIFIIRRNNKPFPKIEWEQVK